MKINDCPPSFGEYMLPLSCCSFDFMITIGTVPHMLVYISHHQNHRLIVKIFDSHTSAMGYVLDTKKINLVSIEVFLKERRTTLSLECRFCPIFGHTPRSFILLIFPCSRYEVKCLAAGSVSLSLSLFYIFFYAHLERHNLSIIVMILK